MTPLTREDLQANSLRANVAYSVEARDELWKRLALTFDELDAALTRERAAQVDRAAEAAEAVRHKEERDEALRQRDHFVSLLDMTDKMRLTAEAKLDAARAERDTAQREVASLRLELEAARERCAQLSDALRRLIENEDVETASPTALLMAADAALSTDTSGQWIAERIAKEREDQADTDKLAFIEWIDGTDSEDLPIEPDVEAALAQLAAKVRAEALQLAEDAAAEALVETRDNERKAISKGSAEYSLNFRHVALVDAVASAIRATQSTREAAASPQEQVVPPRTYSVPALPTDPAAEERYGKLLSERYQVGPRVRRFLRPEVDLSEPDPVEAASNPLPEPVEVPRCAVCNCLATRHKVDDEERRKCRDCECEQFVAPATGVPSLSTPCQHPSRQPHGRHEEYATSGGGRVCRACGARPGRGGSGQKGEPTR